MIDPDTEISIAINAYGQSYASTWKDGLRTAGDCLDNMNTHCLKSVVQRIGTSNHGSDIILIVSEICL